MPRTIRFHLDEDTDPAIAAGLRHHDIDVTTSQEIRLLGAVDPVQLAHAHAERRVLVTHDSDHLVLSAQGLEHSGIAYCHQKKRSLGEIIAGLVLYGKCASPMRCEVEWSSFSEPHLVRVVYVIASCRDEALPAYNRLLARRSRAA
jgi:hypothetical protein